MACAGCTTCSTDGTPAGCRSNGCSTGGCNKKNTYDWLSAMHLSDVQDNFDIVEVSFKNGARKDFYKNPNHVRAITGDVVVVNTGAGQDVGKITLSGELVRLQMRKKKVPEDAELRNVIRIAGSKDLEKLQHVREKEKAVMVRARTITRTLDLSMKVGDVEFQADDRKATFYYTAEGRVDFRELIRHFAKEFKVKIEMRQIGARQESSRIGGIGSCGRELCCSTWLSDFKTVTTSAARYQNLAINQSKLSGQCGRLKCCLNYELDTYMDALTAFPKHADVLITEAGKATLLKIDIFKKIMFYVYEKQRGKQYMLSPDTVREILAMNAKKEKPEDLTSLQIVTKPDASMEEEIEMTGDLDGVIELPMEKRRRRGKRRSRKPQGNRNQKPNGNRNKANKPKQNTSSKSTTADIENPNQAKKESDNKPANSKNQNRNRGRNRNRNKKRPPNRGNTNNNNRNSDNNNNKK